jgi:hypothetical protein
LTPMTLMGKATETGLGEVARQVLAPHFHETSSQSISKKVRTFPWHKQVLCIMYVRLTSRDLQVCNPSQYTKSRCPIARQCYQAGCLHRWPSPLSRPEVV